ncbi:MAG: NAD(P)-binding protein [Hyphomicrobiaceae bacterium]
MQRTLEADYVLIGSGAAGMAFADVIVRHTQSSLIVIDRHAKPGGHWNDAYPFVRLHLPSHYYGVDSTPLELDRPFRGGVNDGLMHMASRDEILAYYERVMADVLLASGRVYYLPMHDWRDGFAVSRISATELPVKANKRYVDGTWSNTGVPSTHSLNYRVDPALTCVAINALPDVPRTFQNYCVVGQGKTGMDACTWLLGQGVSPDRIRWIMPRDAWWADRAKMQFSPEHFDATMDGQIAQMEAVAAARTADEIFLGFEARGFSNRHDRTHLPTMWHSATASVRESDLLRSISDVVRKGRLKEITALDLHLEHGHVQAKPDTLYIDCSATGIPVQAGVPIFQEQRITLELTRALRPCLSAATIAATEIFVDSDTERNAMSQPVIAPGVPGDWPRMMVASMANHSAAQAYPEFARFLADTRLDPAPSLFKRIPATDASKHARIDRFKALAREAFPNILRLASVVV